MRLPRLWSLVLALALLLAASAALAQEKRMALVVGNARYNSIPLNNPENDARLIAGTLRGLGFDVAEHVNLGVREFRRVLREFARRLQEEDGVAVLFYAGHGVQIDGRNYLLPVDINLRDEEEVKDESIDIEDLFLSRLDRARAQVRIVILDACRDNPFRGKTRNIRSTGGLAEMAARGTLIAYSSAPGATAEDGPPGSNSIYTRHLARDMLEEGLEVEQMLKSVRVKVLRDTNQRQVPWVNTSLTVNFSFNPQRGPSVEDIAKQEQSRRLAEIERERQRLEEQVRRLEESERARQKLEDAEKRKLAEELERVRKAQEQSKAPARAEMDAARKKLEEQSLRLEDMERGRKKLEDEKRRLMDDLERARSDRERVKAAAQDPLPTAAPAAGRPRDPFDPKQGAAEVGARKAVTPQQTLGKPDPASPAPGSRTKRCVELLMRAQIGEPLSIDDQNYLQKECNR